MPENCSARRKPKTVRLRVEPGAFFTFAALLLFLKEGELIPVIAALAVHEAGHLAAICACGLRPVSLIAGTGGFIICYRDGDYKKDAVAALAGPALSLLAALCASTLHASRFFAGLNAAFAAFNLIPISGLDGGRAMSALLSVRCSADTVRKTALVSDVLCLSLLFYLGAYAVLRHSNYTFLVSAVYLCIMCCKNQKAVVK